MFKIRLIETYKFLYRKGICFLPRLIFYSKLAFPKDSSFFMQRFFLGRVFRFTLNLHENVEIKVNETEFKLGYLTLEIQPHPLKQNKESHPRPIISP